MPPLHRLRRRFRHHAWAGRLLCDALEARPTLEGARAFAHALAADRVWHRRLTGQPVDIDVWPDLEVDACRVLWASTTADWSAYLERDFDLEAVVAYRTTSGAPFETPVADVLDHVLLHAAHHRGQACAALRAAGAVPPALDLIAWGRAAPLT